MENGRAQEIRVSEGVGVALCCKTQKGVVADISAWHVVCRCGDGKFLNFRDSNESYGSPMLQ